VPMKAECYFVLDKRSGYSGYFTLTAEASLLQVNSDFGDFTYQWRAPETDAKTFLIEGSNAGHKFVSSATANRRITSEKVRQEILFKVRELMTQLWPLFIAQLKAEQTPVTNGGDPHG
jgi:hypothetical protein